MRLIDADTVVTIQVYDDMTEEWGMKKMTIAEAIDEWSNEGCPPTVPFIDISALPIVDNYEIVHCRDCKWWHGVGCAIHIVDESDEPKDDDYCSFGERKEDETD